jgi:hypothetical protein
MVVIELNQMELINEEDVYRGLSRLTESTGLDPSISDNILHRAPSIHAPHPRTSDAGSNAYNVQQELSTTSVAFQTTTGFLSRSA